MNDGVLFPGEVRVPGAHHPVLAWHRPGSPERPLVVLAPGGGHLARVFYGHPGGKPENFLAHWLSEAGFELLALSYPSDHPANPASCSAMTVQQWAEDFAAATATVATPGPEREVVLVGWSMAGRLARCFRVAMRALGLRCDQFLALAATPPLPDLTTPRGGCEPVTGAGLWDSNSRGPQWRLAISDRRQMDGGLPIDLETYERDYRCDNPVRLRCEAREAQSQLYSLGDLLADLRPFDYADYPLVGAVIPTRAADARHALTDEVSWGFLNAQMLYCEAENRLSGGIAGMPSAQWEGFRKLVTGLSARLSRRIEGNHFFFIGENGAAATASHIGVLLENMKEASAWRAALPPVAEEHPYG